MNQLDAIMLRGLIIDNFQSAPSLRQLTAKLNLKSIDDWALSVEEVMGIESQKPEQYYMKQIEKIALIMGIPAKESMEIALRSYADGVKKGLC